MAAPKPHVMGAPIQLDTEAEAQEQGDAGYFRVPFVWDPYDGRPISTGVDMKGVCADLPECLKIHGLEMEVWSSNLKRLQWALEPMQPSLSTRWLGEKAHKYMQDGKVLTAIPEVFCINRLPWCCRILICLPVILPLGVLLLVLNLLREFLSFLDQIMEHDCSTSFRRCMHDRKVTRLRSTTDRLRLWQLDFNEALKPLGLYCKTQSITRVTKEELPSGRGNQRVVTVERFISVAYTPETIEQLKEQPHAQWSLEPSLPSEDQDLMKGLDPVLDLLSLAVKTSL